MQKPPPAAAEAGFTRAEFLRAGLRGLALVGLGAVIGTLAGRSGSGPAHQSCSGDGHCRACPELAGCPQPQALSLRRLNQARPEAPDERG